MKTMKTYPAHIFIDTGVFVRGQFNFSSSQLNYTELLKVVENPSLVIPIVTKHEIDRHRERISSQNSSPLLKSLNNPQIKSAMIDLGLTSVEEAILKQQIEEKYLEHYQTFLRCFKIIPLSYKDIDIQKVLEWRDELSPPYSDKKKNEYPDAMALSSLLNFTERTKLKIAVIAVDGDWSNVCKVHDQLEYFDSIASFVEHHVTNVELSDKVKEILIGDGKLVDMIKSHIDKTCFTVVRGHDGRVEKIDVKKTIATKLSIVENSSNVLTIVFNVVYEVYTESRYMDLNSSNHDGKGVPVPYPVSLRENSHINMSGKCYADISDIDEDIIRINEIHVEQNNVALF